MTCYGHLMKDTQGLVSDEWSRGDNATIFYKGSKMECKIYSKVKSISYAAKLLQQILLHGNKDNRDKQLGEEHIVLKNKV